VGQGHHYPFVHGGGLHSSLIQVPLLVLGIAWLLPMLQAFEQ
jgi:hypothetical protein